MLAWMIDGWPLADTVRGDGAHLQLAPQLTPCCLLAFDGVTNRGSLLSDIDAAWSSKEKNSGAH